MCTYNLDDSNLTFTAMQNTFTNLFALDFDLSRSFKVKCEGALGLPIYGFLLVL